jgi:ABC-2 type transport system permease protein
MTYAYVLRRTLANGFAELRNAYTVRTWLLGWMLRLAAQVTFFALVGRALHSADMTRYLAVGNAVVLACLESTIVVISCNDERAHGTFSLLIASPVGHVPVLLARGLHWVLTGMVSSTVALVTVPVLVGTPLPWGRLVAAIPLMWIVSFTSYAYGCALCGLVLRHPQLDWLILNVGYLTVMTLGGVDVPVSFWPTWLSWVSDILPVTHGLMAVRAVLDGGPGVAGQVVRELAVGAGWLLVGVFSLRRFTDRGRRNGTIEFG